MVLRSHFPGSRELCSIEARDVCYKKAISSLLACPFSICGSWAGEGAQRKDLRSRSVQDCCLARYVALLVQDHGNAFLTPPVLMPFLTRPVQVDDLRISETQSYWSGSLGGVGKRPSSIVSAHEASARASRSDRCLSCPVWSCFVLPCSVLLCCDNPSFTRFPYPALLLSFFAPREALESRLSGSEVFSCSASTLPYLFLFSVFCCSVSFRSLRTGEWERRHRVL